MLLPRESLLQLAIRHFKKKGGNWAESVFVFRPSFHLVSKVSDDMTVKPAYHLLVL